MRRPIARAVALAGLAAAGAALVAAPASAVGDESNAGGRWYVDWYDVAATHASGIDGTGVTIAMIDSPINTQVPTLQSADISTFGPIGCTGADGEPLPAESTDVALAEHGTNVASYLVGSGAGYPGQVGVKGMAPGASLLAYAIYEGDDKPECVTDDFTNDQIANAINDAVDRGADIISVSLGRPASTDELVAAVANALRHEVIIVAALANKDESYSMDGPPATLNGVLSVGAMRPDSGAVTDALGQPTTSVDTDVVAPGWDLVLQGTVAGGWEAQELGGGTSFATPIVAGDLALAMQKFPSATTWQLVQALLRNTGVDGEHDLLLDPTNTFGYGAADTISLLASDPTLYDDANPLIEDMSRRARAENDPERDWDWGPTRAQIEGTAASASPTPSASPDATAAPAPSTDGPGTDAGSETSTVLLVIGGALVVALLAVIAALAVIMSKRRGGEGR